MGTSKAETPPAGDVPATLAEALAAFQAALPHVDKDNTGVIPGKNGKEGYSYTFADLAAVSEVALPLLGKVGLSWSTKPTVNESGHFVLEYRLRHVGGEEDIGCYPLPSPLQTAAQSVGSAITYARRYALCSVTGIAPGGDDDDAAAAPQPPPQRGGNTNDGQRRNQTQHQGQGRRPSGSGQQGQPNAAAKAKQASEASRALLDAESDARVEHLASVIRENKHDELDAAPHLTANDREALGLERSDKVSVGDLRDMVMAYRGRHGVGPRQASPDEHGVTDDTDAGQPADDEADQTRHPDDDTDAGEPAGDRNADF